MEIKEGSRVRVLKLNGNEVDFYATLATYERFPEEYVVLTNCSDEVYDNELAFAPGEFLEGEDRADYYELVEEEFKEGDRVHVTRLNGEIVDFYGTLKTMKHKMFRLDNCTDSMYEGQIVVGYASPNFNLRCDYYTLVTNEEDIEEEGCIKSISIRTSDGEELLFDEDTTTKEDLNDLETDVLMYLTGLSNKRAIVTHHKKSGCLVINAEHIISMRRN